MSKRKRGLKPATPPASGSTITKSKKKKNSSARKRARAELLQTQGASSSATAAAGKPAPDPEEAAPEPAAKKAKTAPPQATQAPAKEQESSDEGGSDSGTSVSSDKADEREVTEFDERLRAFLEKHGEAHIGTIGRKVPRPEALKLGKFFAAHKDHFKVTAGKISLVDCPAAAVDTGTTAADAGARRARPNVLVTGTPGVGKTTFCKTLAEASGLAHIEVSKVVTEEKLYKEWDDEMNCSIFDDELVGDALEPRLQSGGTVVDFHSSGWMAEDWFDLVLVLRADTQVLYSRLEARGYSEAKIKGNMDAEIFQTCLEEARELFSAEDEDTSSVPIWECSNNTAGERDASLERVRKFIAEWGSS